MSEKLRTAITTEGMGKHLEALQAIATDNGGNRASGFQGYGASVQYVLQTLRGAGYNATSQVFDFVTFAENTDPVLEQTAPTPRTFGEDEFLTMSYSASGDPPVRWTRSTSRSQATRPTRPAAARTRTSPASRTATSR